MCKIDLPVDESLVAVEIPTADVVVVAVISGVVVVVVVVVFGDVIIGGTFSSPPLV